MTHATAHCEERLGDGPPGRAPVHCENTCGGEHKAHTSRNVGLGTEATAGLGGDRAHPRERAGTHRVLSLREDAACATLNRDGAMPDSVMTRRASAMSA